jgi:hypothetical protein
VGINGSAQTPAAQNRLVTLSRLRAPRRLRGSDSTRVLVSPSAYSSYVVFAYLMLQCCARRSSLDDNNTNDALCLLVISAINPSSR